jgi:hypothetical protein
LRDFQARWESPAFGLFHGAASSTALFTHNFCYRAPEIFGNPEGQVIYERLMEEGLSVGCYLRSQAVIARLAF